MRFGWLEKLAASSAAIRQRLLAMTDDDQLRVRYQLAFSLGELPASQERNAALVKLAKHDFSDRYVPRCGCLARSAKALATCWRQLAVDQAFLESREGRELLASLAAQIGASNGRKTSPRRLKALTALAQANSSALPIIIQRLAARSGTPLAEQIRRSNRRKGRGAHEIAARRSGEARRR